MRGERRGLEAVQYAQGRVALVRSQIVKALRQGDLAGVSALLEEDTRAVEAFQAAYALFMQADAEADEMASACI